MSMTINLVEDHNIYLCEGGPVYNGGVQPTPITYLTQWKIVGNSEVHSVGNLTSWKVSGNSVVQDGVIMSCGDLGQDGKYHVKISNGVTIYDIPLDAPLRKVNDVADTIEFPSGTDGKALVTRNFGKYDIGLVDWVKANQPVFRMQYTSSIIKRGTSNIICAKYRTLPGQTILTNSVDKSVWVYDSILRVRDEDYLNSTVADFQQDNLGVLILFELATPTTELIDVSPFSVSPTDTYTSANVTPYSAFEHKKNVEIWSCGEYNATDGKWHILVQPQGGSIADIALTEPLRKVNDVADKIEFPSGTEGKALVTRNLASVDIGTLNFRASADIKKGIFTTSSLYNCKYTYGLTADGEQEPTINSGAGAMKLQDKDWCFLVRESTDTCFFITYYAECAEYNASEFAKAMSGKEFLYELATPTTELVDAPQIEEADSYSMVISQGAKAISWSNFETE